MASASVFRFGFGIWTLDFGVAVFVLIRALEGGGVHVGC